MSKLSTKYESEVQLGLLATILVLLVLNVTSNYVSFNARVALQETVEAELNNSAVVISRQLEYRAGDVLTDEQVEQLRQQRDLSVLIYFPSPPSKEVVTVDWLLTAPALGGDPGSFANIIQGAEFRKIIHGNGDEFLLLYPLPSKSTGGTLILGVREPLLAYLDSAGRTTIIVSIIAALVVLVVYILLSRLVLSPFRRIRKEALEAGRPIGQDSDEVDSIVRDYREIISQLKEQEKQLLELNRRTRHRADSIESFNEHLLGSIDTGVVTIDLQGKVKTLNSAASRILGHDHNAVVGEHYWELFRPSIKIIDAVSRALDCGKNEAYCESEYETVASGKLILGATVSTIRDGNGEPIGVSVMINDLTELSALRSQLEVSERLAALGEMAGGLAHQVRNSLGAISGYGTLIKKKLISRNLPPDNAVALIQETREAESLIERFLYFARPLHCQLTRVALCSLVEELLEGFRVREDCSLIRFVHRAEQEIVVNADGLLLKQAIGNLIENSVNAYQGGPGTVTIEYRVVGRETIIDISDTGCGIDEEASARIFTPFFSTRPSGTGLGLPLVKKIVDLHNGRLSFKSAEGQGTTFTVSLPSTALSEKQTAESSVKSTG